MTTDSFPAITRLVDELGEFASPRVISAMAKANALLQDFDSAERRLIALAVMSYKAFFTIDGHQPEISDFAAFKPGVSPGTVQIHWKRLKQRKGVHLKIHAAHALAVISLLKFEQAAKEGADMRHRLDDICDGVAFTTRAVAGKRLRDTHVDEETLAERTHPLKRTLCKIITRELVLANESVRYRPDEELANDVLLEGERLTTEQNLKRKAPAEATILGWINELRIQSSTSAQPT